MATGFCRETVSQVVRQPHARDYIINEAKKTVQDEIREVLEKEALPSIKMLVEVRDDVLSKNGEKLQAANALLDRFLGKPTQPITTNTKPPSEMSDDELRKQVEQEIAASHEPTPESSQG